MNTFRGYRIAVARKSMNRDQGWWYTVKAPDGGVIAEGWCIGYGPRAKSQAMKDAIAAVNRRHEGRAA